MVTPVTGPFTIVKSSGEIRTDTRSGHRQRRPYDLVLPFTREVGQVTSRRGLGSGSVTSTRSILLAQSPDASQRDLSWNLARNSWLDAIGDDASIGISIAQSRMAMSMVAHRLGQLAAFSRSLRSLDSKMVARMLGISQRRAHHVMQPYHVRSGLPQQKKVSPYGYARERQIQDVHETSRALANLWLEFWFGWKPAVSDIYAAMEVLDAPFKATRVRGHGKAGSVRVFGGASPATEVITQSDVYRTRFGGDVEVTNPNLRLMQQLGILNPAVVALDLVPWSFVAGWFFNLQEYFSSWTDFAGLALHRAYVVQKTDSSQIFTWKPCVACSDWDKAQYLFSRSTAEASLYSRQQLSEIPQPKIRLSLFGLSNIRALTSISLLTQQLPTGSTPVKRPPRGSTSWGI